PAEDDDSAHAKRASYSTRIVQRSRAPPSRGGGADDSDAVSGSLCLLNDRSLVASCRPRIKSVNVGRWSESLRELNERTTGAAATSNATLTPVIGTSSSSSRPNIADQSGSSS